MFVNPTIKSYYKEHRLGEVLYNMVRSSRPKNLVEFGTYNGYSTACIAQAIRDNGFGKLISYDLWESYPFKKGTLNRTQENLSNLGLDKYVELLHGDFNDWIKKPTKFDFLHVDISNTGDFISELTKLNTKRNIIVFEGGTIERDEVKWMKEFNKTPIVGSAEYIVLDERFPSISIII